MNVVITGGRNCKEEHLVYADWDTYGKSAGPIRNKQMVDLADRCTAIWDGKSKGTANTIELSMKKGIDALIFRY